jgi:oxygen-independent coproporphyrinogen-3 oxidase
MPGIYFHIPFCKSVCSYCDFYKTTNIDLVDTLVLTLKKELLLRSNYLNGQNIETIYFGGGTPSLLKQFHFDELLNTCNSLFNIDSKAEITVEVNPDDLSFDYLKKLHKTGINRLSIGVQSFGSSHLKLMQRRHSSKQAYNAVSMAQKAGFDNISVDLIYGVPGMSMEQWDKNLKQIFKLKIQHISAYHLTYHKKTQMWSAIKKGIIKEVPENDSIKQFKLLIEESENNGFEHYEISNFAKNGLYSRHNSSYWKQIEYLGLGPSAHSFNIISRQWNVSNLNKYIDAIGYDEIPATVEKLNINDRYNDYVITSLRTRWGIDVKYIEQNFGKKYIKHLNPIIAKYATSKKLKFENNTITLTLEGMFISDSIMADLIY